MLLLRFVSLGGFSYSIIGFKDFLESYSELNEEFCWDSRIFCNIFYDFCYFLLITMPIVYFD